jgi:hypothetical protein
MKTKKVKAVRELWDAIDEYDGGDGQTEFMFAIYFLCCMAVGRRCTRRELMALVDDMYQLAYAGELRVKGADAADAADAWRT